MDLGMDLALTEQICMIRITPLELMPTNYVVGKVSLLFEVFCHSKINQLSNYQTRLNMISQQIIELFNGAEILGMGRLFFDARASSRCKMQIQSLGNIPYKYNSLVMVNWI
jgi:hypothetical protein